MLLRKNERGHYTVALSGARAIDRTGWTLQKVQKPVFRVHLLPPGNALKPVVDVLFRCTLHLTLVEAKTCHLC